VAILNSHSMTVCIYCDAEEKILQQTAFAYDKWSVSHFLPVTSPNVHRFLKSVLPANSTINP